MNLFLLLNITWAADVFQICRQFQQFYTCIKDGNFLQRNMNGGLIKWKCSEFSLPNLLLAFG